VNKYVHRKVPPSAKVCACTTLENLRCQRLSRQRNNCVHVWMNRWIATNTLAFSVLPKIVERVASRVISSTHARQTQVCRRWRYSPIARWMTAWFRTEPTRCWRVVSVRHPRSWHDSLIRFILNNVTDFQWFCYFSWSDSDMPTHALPCTKYNSMRHPTEFHLFVSQGTASTYFRWSGHFMHILLKIYSAACLPISSKSVYIWYTQSKR